MIKRFIKPLSIVVAVSVSTAHADQNLVGDDLSTIDISSIKLSKLISLYQEAGIPILYSSVFINNAMIVQNDAPHLAPIKRLNYVLAHFGLALEQESYSGDWLVVPANNLPKAIHLNILDHNNRKPIDNASVILNYEPEPKQSNRFGNVDLVVSTDEIAHANLTIDHPDYGMKTVPLAAALKTSTVTLEPLATSISEIIVVGSFHKRMASTIQGSQKSDAELINAPNRGGDPIKTLDTIPGTSSIGVSSRPNIRGGVSDELSIYYDGVELINPFHLKDYHSLVSGINLATVDSVDIYTGGFPAMFGNKLSGVMDIHTFKSQGQYANEVEWNFLSTSAKISGGNDPEDDWWLASYRRGNLDIAIEIINEDIGAPEYHDAYATKHWKINEQSAFELSYLRLKDHIVLQSLDNLEGEYAKSSYQSDYLWATFDIKPNNQIQTIWRLNHTAIEDSTSGYINEPNNPDETTGSLDNHKEVSRTRLQGDIQWQTNDNTLIQTGGYLEYDRGRFQHTVTAQRGEAAELFGLSRRLDYNEQSSTNGANASFYLNYRTGDLDDFIFEPGIRLDYQHRTGQSTQQISPRFAVKKNLSDLWSWKFSLGRYYQAATMDEYLQESGLMGFYPPQKSDHGITGLNFNNASGDFAWDIELYYKHIYNPRPRAENLFNSFSLLPELAVDRIIIEADSAELYGLDTYAEWYVTPEFKFKLGYSYAKANDHIGTQTVPRRWNQNQTIRLGLDYTTQQVSLSAQLTWHTGWYTTQIPDTVYANDIPLNYQRNNQQLPEYLSLDLKATYTRSLPNSNLMVYLELLNATNKANVGATELEVEILNNQSQSIQLLEERVFPIVPILGIKWSF